MSADHQSLRTSIAHLWARRAEQVRAETEGQLATELRALEERGLFPGPSSQAGHAAGRAARREGESILRGTLTEALEIDSIGREGLGNDELVHDLESAFQTCIEDWARRRVPRLLTLANFRSVTNDIEREVVFHLKTALGRDIRAEVAKLWLGRHAQQDSSAASLGADRRAVEAGTAQALDTAKSDSTGTAQEAPAAGSLPPVSDDGTEMKGHLDELPAAQAKTPKEGGGQGSWTSAGVFVAAATAAFVPGIVQFGEGRAETGWILLAFASGFAITGIFFWPGLRTGWRWWGLRIALSLLVLGAVVVSGRLASKPKLISQTPPGIPERRQVSDAAAVPDLVDIESPANTPEAEPVEPEAEAPVREAEQPPPPAPVIGAGATVIQETSGDNSHNIIAREVVVEQTGPRPRTISVEQRTRLIEALKRGPQGNVRVVSVVGDVEGNAFADQIREVLVASGWSNCEPHQRLYVGGNPVGFGVVVHDAESAPPSCGCHPAGIRVCRYSLCRGRGPRGSRVSGRGSGRDSALTLPY